LCQIAYGIPIKRAAGKAKIIAIEKMTIVAGRVMHNNGILIHSLTFFGQIKLLIPCPSNAKEKGGHPNGWFFKLSVHDTAIIN
jgi:hypothetical protein